MIKRNEKPTEVIIYLADEREENQQVKFETAEFAVDDEGLEVHILDIVTALSNLQDTCEGEYLVVVDGVYHNVRLQDGYSDRTELVYLKPEGI